MNDKLVQKRYTEFPCVLGICFLLICVSGRYNILCSPIFIPAFFNLSAQDDAHVLSYIPFGLLPLDPTAHDTSSVSANVTSSSDLLMGSMHGTGPAAAAAGLTFS